MVIQEGSRLRKDYKQYGYIRVFVIILLIDIVLISNIPSHY